MSEDVLRIAREAQRLLDITKSVFQENNIILPPRQFLALGEIGTTAHDEEQLSVSFGNMSEGLPNSSGGPIPQSCNTSYQGSFNVEIVRCTPQMVPVNRGAKEIPPPPEKITEYSVSRYIEAWLLVKVAQRFAAGAIASSVYTINTGADSGGTQGIILSINTPI